MDNRTHLRNDLNIYVLLIYRFFLGAVRAGGFVFWKKVLFHHIQSGAVPVIDVSTD